ncbi:hypothetical protein D1007_14750 [Hordeum vulgare]|nr:hypothetical protein D1007_14750 [Hordeum vulgare]
MATHRHLMLLRIATDIPGLGLVQDFLVYNTYDPSSLRALPPCTEPYTDYYTARATSCPVVLLSRYSAANGTACVYRSLAPMVAMILATLCWDTDAAVPFNGSLCWIDYRRGILICDVFGDPVPTVSFLAFPLNDFPPLTLTSRSSRPAGYTGVCPPSTTVVCSSEEYSSEHEISENSQSTSERLFILSNRAFLTPAQYMKCLEKVEEIKFKPPFYVSIMSKTTLWQHDSECSPILINSIKSPKYLYACVILTFALCYVYK